MRKSSRFHALALTAAMALQTIGAPVSYAAQADLYAASADGSDQDLQEGEEPLAEDVSEEGAPDAEDTAKGVDAPKDDAAAPNEDDAPKLEADEKDELIDEELEDADEAEEANDMAFEVYDADEGEASDPRGVAVEGRGDLLWAVDMNDLDAFDLYTGPNQGVWSSNDGVVRIDGGNGNKAISKRQDFSDFVLEADVTVEKQADLSDKSSAQGGILFRASRGADRQNDGYYGYYLGLNAKGQEMILGRCSGNNWFEIATKKMKVEFGKTYHLTVTAAGSHITCYADYNGENYAKLYINDTTHQSGGIGMRNWLSHSSFRNLAVSEYTEELPSENSSYTNPLLNKCADPDILYYKGTYYLYPTSAGDDAHGIKVYTSTDLVHWTDQGYAFSKGDGWGSSGFWAPDIIERDGVFYMYYVANEQICVAKSTSPMGPFKQDVIEPMDGSEKNIDAHIFYDEASDKYYIYYVRFTGGNVIWGAELSDDMMSIKKDTLKQIVNANQGWDQDMGNINEGPFMLVHDGKYYMTYSGAHFQSINYGSAFAVADSPLGDFKKYEYNPVMKSNATVHGTGHHCITESPDGTEMFIVYHSHHDLNSTEPRQLCIDRIHFTTDAEGNTILEVKGPTITPQALPSGAVDVANFIEAIAPADIKVADGASAEDVNAALYDEVTVITSKGDYTAEVDWDEVTEDDLEGAQITVKGTVVLPEGVENLGDADLSVSVNVILGVAKIKENLQKTLDSIEIPSADAIRGNITLPSEKDGAELTWESDKEEVISSKDQAQEGYYDIPAGVVKRGDKDEKVTLTVTGSVDGVTLSRDIEVTVLAATEADTDYTGYLYAHFKEIPGEKGEQDIFYGISTDGLNWTALNRNEAVLKSDVSDKATRDPYIIRSAEGDRFFLLATDQDIYKYGSNIPWDTLSSKGSTALTIWESTDLIHWEKERNVDVAGSIGGGCAWAPEAIYDDATGEYLVYWASKIAADNYARQYTFVSRTRDFYTFTEPELFNDFGSNIDTSVMKEGDDYYRLTKIEDGMYVRLDKASGHIRSYGDQVSEKKIGNLTFNVVGNNFSYIRNTDAGCLESYKGSYEGGTMFKFNDRDEWCVMLDEYGGAARGYIPFTTTDLDAPNSIKALPEGEYTPQEGCKHGVILPVTEAEYEALIKAYGVEAGLLASLEKKDTPVAEYDFERVDGDKVVAGGEDLGLTVKGSAAVVDDKDAEGNDTKVLYLDGSDESFAAFTGGVFDGMDELTLSLDVKAERADDSSMLMALGADDKGYLYIRVQDDETSAGNTARGNNGIKKVACGNYGTYGRWLHLDLVVENNTISFYTDGLFVGSVKNRNISELGKDLDMFIGKSLTGGRNFRGSVDNLKIYNKALTKEELGAEDAVEITVKIEAETGTITGKAKAVARGDASGGYKVGYIDDTASVVTMKINAPHDGTYRVDIAADGDKGAFPNTSHRYWVNGDEAGAKVIEYTKATNWDVWSLYSVYVDLHKGENTFSVSHSGRDSSFAELDYIIFHALEEPEYDIYVGDEKLEGFDPEKKVFAADAEDLENLPEVKVVFGEGTAESFKATVTQATADRPESYVTIYSSEDPSYMKKYTVRFNTKDSFQSMVVNFGADPFVTYHDGYYYYIRMGRSDQGIWITKTADLSRIGQVEPVCVYRPSGDQPNRELWAPELHFIDGKWYIYYTAGAGSQHRMMVLESVTDDAQGEYVFKGKMSPETDRWAIDQTVLELDGQLYAIWSGWEGFVDGEQRLYIAKMENPWTISGDRVELSKPEFAWEVNEHPTINEGAEIAIAPDGTVNIVYSASGSWSDTYCLGCLTLKKGADPMSKDSWIKATKPVFEKNDSTTFSTGHASFVASPDGKEDYLVYHATRFAGGGWNGRGVRVQRVYWNEDGTPFLGTAAEYNDKVKIPSGTVKVDYKRMEAEDAELSGLSKSTTYNSSNEGCVYGFTDETKTATFTFDVDKAGSYMLYLGASADVDGAGLKVNVNGTEYAKDIYNFNANSGGPLCVDNWFGYAIEVAFAEGSNTVVVSGDSSKNTAALDYIEYADLDEATSPNPEPVVEPEEPVCEHEYVTEIVKATLTEDGYVKEVCSLCGEVASETVIAHIADVKLSLDSAVYTGKAIVPEVTVIDAEGAVIPAEYYDVTAKDNKKVGTANVTVTFKGLYEAAVTKQFTITPKAVSLRSVARGFYMLDVTWDAIPDMGAGYEVQLSTDKNFKKNTTSFSISNPKTSHKLIMGLSSKKTYYMRVRAVSKVGNSAWSKVASAKPLSIISLVEWIVDLFK
ncbi:family 43 glycosylhydrolase [Butyrivibrio sp. MC2013]|uniref:family 43 glycosylhydrolase n=1 Tax=Butyrivibrio sp. MC2013 TaxID=1280686 RepID=UPI00041063CF|nr:family 43 glycosylhydrolase [Butyrivibrio sp. MC2013]